MPELPAAWAASQDPVMELPDIEFISQLFPRFLAQLQNFMAAIL